MVKVDLHIHSTASDGEYTPSQLVEIAKKAQIQVMAITDHDTVSGLEEGKKAAKEAGIIFIPGVELSIDGWKELHMLGYGVDYKSESFVSYLNLLYQERVNRGKRILDYLETKQVFLDYQEILKKTKGVVARPHIAQEMVEKGYVQDIEMAFKKYLATDEFFRVDKRLRPTLEEGIALIHKAHGLAVLAHPYSLKLTIGELDSILKLAKSYGLDGMECEYARYDRASRNRLRELANKYDLMITSGSDFHGEHVRPDVKLGDI